MQLVLTKPVALVPAVVPVAQRPGISLPHAIFGQKLRRVERRNVSTLCSSPVRSEVDWAARKKERFLQDLIEAGRKKTPPPNRAVLAHGLEALGIILPGFEPNVELMRANDWVAILTDPSSVVAKVVMLKQYYPKLDLSLVLTSHPRLLLKSVGELEKSAQQVAQLLSTAEDIDAIMTELPELLDPKVLISVLVTVRKWYDNKRDPIDVLQKSPSVVQKAWECDVAFEPVYMDEEGNWVAPSLNYREKRADWQKHIDKHVFKID